MMIVDGFSSFFPLLLAGKRAKGNMKIFRPEASNARPRKKRVKTEKKVRSGCQGHFATPSCDSWNSTLILRRALSALVPDRNSTELKRRWIHDDKYFVTRRTNFTFIHSAKGKFPALDKPRKPPVDNKLLLWLELRLCWRRRREAKRCLKHPKLKWNEKLLSCCLRYFCSTQAAWYDLWRLVARLMWNICCAHSTQNRFFSAIKSVSCHWRDDFTGPW